MWLDIVLQPPPVQYDFIHNWSFRFELVESQPFNKLLWGRAYTWVRRPNEIDAESATLPR